MRLYRKIGSAWKLSPLVIAILILELPMKGMYPMLLLSMQILIREKGNKLGITLPLLLSFVTHHGWLQVISMILPETHEKQGGLERSEASFSDFRTILSEGDLYDLQHCGECLSWQGVRETHDIKCRLDRSLVNSSWSELYPSGRCEYLRFDSSDHRPIITLFESI